MYNFLLKYGTATAFGVGALIAVIFFIMAVSGVNSMGGSPTNEELYPKTFFDFGMKATYFLFIVALLALVFFGIFQVVTNPKGAMLGIISVTVLLVVFFISYSMASGDVSADIYKKFEISSTVSKIISAGISTTTLLLVGAVLVGILAEVRGIFK